MQTQFYTVASGLTVTRDDDYWGMPAYVGHAIGRIGFRIASDGIACHQYTSGAGSEQFEHNTYAIEIGGPLRGWGHLDCDYTYEIAGASVPGPFLEKVAKWSGLKLPVRAESV